MAQFDYAVIGGGIAGISAAAELATSNRVLVLEREPHLAYHTTGRSAAIYSETYGRAASCWHRPPMKHPRRRATRSLKSWTLLCVWTDSSTRSISAWRGSSDPGRACAHSVPIARLPWVLTGMCQVSSGSRGRAVTAFRLPPRSHASPRPWHAVSGCRPICRTSAWTSTHSTLPDCILSKRVCREPV
jgi:choline dehydrogenase-like flavoprotein